MPVCVQANSDFYKHTLNIDIEMLAEAIGRVYAIHYKLKSRPWCQWSKTTRHDFINKALIALERDELMLYEDNCG